MKLSELISLDSTWQFLSSPIIDEEVLGLATIEGPLPQHLLFAKDLKYLSKISQLPKDLLDLKKVGLLIEGDYKEDFHLKKETFAFVGHTKNVMMTVCKFSEAFYKKKFQHFNGYVDGRQMGTATIHPTAFLAQGVFVGENVTIGPHVKIYPGSVLMGHNTIHEGSEIFPHCTLYPFVTIGKNCRLHSGAVLGADGFGYHFYEGIHHKIWHMGGVIIDDDVEIGANSAVDGGTFSPTLIGKGSKLDNHVQVGHNCRIGKGVILCGHVAIGGSSSVGDYTVFGGKAGMGPQMTLGSHCQIAGGALVNRDWPSHSILGGPAP